MTTNNLIGENGMENLWGEYEDALFRIAMLELEMEKAERLMADIETGKADIDMDFVDREEERARPKMYRLIDLQLRRAGVRHFMENTLPKAGMIAACAIAVLAIGAATTLAASKAVRMKVFDFLINTKKEYTELSLVEREGSDFDVPAEWTGDYYPSYIPEGYYLVEVEGYPGWSSAFYQNDEGGYFFFHEYDENSSTNINTEGAEIRQIEIHGTPALCAINGNITYFTWSEGNRYFVITFHGKCETDIEVAKSTVRVNNH